MEETVGVNRSEAAEAMRNMVHVETKSGFVCDIPRARYDNWALVLAAQKSGRGDSSATIDYVDIIMTDVLDAKDAERLKDHVSEGGRIPFTALLTECNEISAAASKN